MRTLRLKQGRLGKSCFLGVYISCCKSRTGNEAKHHNVGNLHAAVGQLPSDWDRSSGQCWRDGGAQTLPDWCKTGPVVSASRFHQPSSFWQQPLIVLGWRTLSSEPPSSSSSEQELTCISSVDKLVWNPTPVLQTLLTVADEVEKSQLF